MTDHGGVVMTSNVTYALFSGPDWQANSTFTGDKITSIESFLNGLGESSYSTALMEYDNIGLQSSYQGRIVDNGTALSANVDPSQVVTYVCNQLNANGITPRNDAVYVVLTEDPPSLPDTVGLAWHWYGWCDTYYLIKVAFVKNLDGKDYVTDGVYRSSDAAALVDAMAHEVFETATDPTEQGWYVTNANGGEVADKCNFVFDGYLQLANGDHFKVQTEWSNTANDQGSGLPNGNDPPEPGCVGQAPPGPREVGITGPQDIPLHESDKYTAAASGGWVPPLTYEWRQRDWSGGLPLDWSPWFSSGSNNYTYASVNSCGYDGFDLQVRITDGASATVTSSDYHVVITNPC